MGRFELTKQLINGPERRIKYSHQLTGTDRMLGQIIQAIKDSGTYEESLIIITSDHNIKGFGFDMKRIPLIIKWPHQQKAKKVFSKVTSLDIFKMLNLFIQSQKYDESPLSFQNANY
jgi:arylsulfatase A-like enzyme